MAQIYFPWMYVRDPTSGRPIALGSLLFGEPDLDPEIPANQIQVRAKQEDGTLVNIPQPVQLNAGGVPSYNGSPVILDIEQGEFSWKVLDQFDAQVYYNENNIPITIDSGQIADGAITTPKIEDGAVTTPKIADDAVDNDKLADDSVDLDKIDDATILAIREFSYPVGSLYFNATDGTDPNTLLGFGTWTAFAEGRVPVGVGSTTDDRGENLNFNQGDSGGEFRHVLTTGELAAHSHGVTDPGHNHSIDEGGGSGNGFFGGSGSPDAGIISTETTGISINSTGSVNPHNNQQPYIAVYIWQRTA